MPTRKIKLAILLTSSLISASAVTAHSAENIPHVPYTQGDIEAKISCAVAVSKAEFFANKIGVYGTPRVCLGVKADELDRWNCISLNLDKTRNFSQATASCLIK